MVRSFSWASLVMADASVSVVVVVVFVVVDIVVDVVLCCFMLSLLTTVWCRFGS